MSDNKGLRFAVRLVLGFLLVLPMAAPAETHKCKKSDGTTVYQDRPCEAGSKAVEFSPPKLQSSSGAQLQHGAVGNPVIKGPEPKYASSQSCKDFVAKPFVMIGSPVSALYEACGFPGKSNDDYGPWGKKSQLVYDYLGYVYVTNDTITSFQKR